jgi:hypothetical protein
MTHQRNSNDTRYLATHGPELLANGYEIVPIKPGYKYPKGLTGWHNITADRAQLSAWLANGYADAGVGVLTRYAPAVDIDVNDDDIVKLLIAWCDKHIGPTVHRVGRAPKVLLAYRSTKPMAKMMSSTYTDWTGTANRVEILGDGNQYVAYAIHPGTGQPYIWTTAHGLAETPHDSLPIITPEQAQALIDYYHSIVPDDWTPVAKTARQPNPSSVQASSQTAADRLLLNAKPPIDISDSDLQQALSLIPADDYHDWVTVGMALHHQYRGGEAGYRLWDKWSSKSSRYKAEGMLAKWYTYRDDPTRHEQVTVATILHMAKQYRHAEDSNTDASSTADLLAEHLRRYIYVQDGDRVCDLDKPPHCCLAKLPEHRNMTANQLIDKPTPTKQDPDRAKPVPVHQVWLTHDQRQSAHGEEYKPNAGRIITDSYGLRWINQYHIPPHNYTDATDNIAVYLDHMAYLIPSEVEREWMISWMAYCIQRPETRCKVTPLHISIPHGTGRGWIVELMGRLLGAWNVTKTKMDILAGEGNGSGYHDYMHNSLLCAIEEVREGTKRYALSDRIRDILTEPRLEINLKYGSKGTRSVYTNYLLMSNHPDALILTHQDRRINVLSGPTSPQPREYYDRLYAWLDTDGVAQLYHWLKRRDITTFDWVRSMDTPGRRNMINYNQSETEALYWELMSSPPYPIMTMHQISRSMSLLSDRDAYDVQIDDGQLTKLLQHHAKSLDRIKINSKVYRPWQLSDSSQSYNIEQIRYSLTMAGL